MSRTIFINGRFYSQAVTGVQRYAREIVAAIDRQLSEAPDDHDWVLLTPTSVEPVGLKSIRQKSVGIMTGHAWEQADFFLRSVGGVALSLAMAGPALHPRHLVVLHDASVFRHPEFFGRTYGTAHRALERVLRRTARLATVSRFSQTELSQVLDIPANDILLAPNGSEHLMLAPDPAIVDRLGLADQRYFLTVGSLTQNKNLMVAVRSLARLRGRRTGEAPVKLVCVGGANDAVFRDADLLQSDDVIFTGRLTDEEVTGLLRSALALIFPSIYEGFGIPPLEAMLNGCPVIASAIPAVQEVCGEGAVYFSPHDDQRLSGLMEKALLDLDWRSSLVAKGRLRPPLYSWKYSAETLMNECRRLA